MITTIIFDLDDTLYSEIDYCKSGFTAVSEYLGRLPDTPDAKVIYDVLWKEFTSGNRRTTFNAALDDLGITYDDKFIHELINVHRNHRPNITLPAESREILREFNDKYTLALITDGFLPAQQLKVEALAIEKYFKVIIYTEQLGREFWKPSPVGFEKIMANTDAKAENICYIADNEKKDFLAPNNLGFVTIQLLRPDRLHTKTRPEPNAKASYTIKTLSQLPKLIENL